MIIKLCENNLNIDLSYLMIFCLRTYSRTLYEEKQIYKQLFHA